MGRDRMVYVVMPLSLINIISLIPELIYPDEIWTDECHHSAADTWEDIYRYFNRAQRIGLTATLRRTDGKGFDHLYTDIVSTITMADAIEAGYLAKPLCIVPEQYHLEVRIRSGDYDPAEQAAQLGKVQIIGDVIAKYGDVFCGKPVLVACSTFEHAEKMTAAFTDAGWKFEHIHSGLAKHDRRRMLREIKTGKLHGLCTVGIGIEGMDIPGLYGLIWLRRTLSLTIYLQFIGRVLRPMEGKKYGIILDPVGNLFIHGFPESDRTWTLEGNGSAKDCAKTDGTQMRICPECGVANNPENEKCHFCGAGLFGQESGDRIMRQRHLPTIIDGELVAVTSDGMAQTLHEHVERIRAENLEEARLEARPMVTKPLTPIAKRDILRRGLFDGKRPLFDEAVRGMK